MTTRTLSRGVSSRFLSYGFATIFFCLLPAGQALEPQKPDFGNRPAFLIYSKVVVFPKGIEEPPDNFQPTLRGGIQPEAIILIDGKTVGEIYAKPLKGSAKKEADEMAGSKGLKLKERSSMKINGETVEIVTLTMDVQSKYGRPCVIYSIYLPVGESSVTFKMITSEMDLPNVLPLFKGMVFFKSEKKDAK
jgi:hypothetical protein